MAFPQIQSNSTFSSGSDATLHTVTLPTGITSGDLLVAFFAVDGVPEIIGPSGWNQLNYFSGSGNALRSGVWWRVADGTEVNPLWTLDVTDSAAAVILRISGFGDLKTGSLESLAVTDHTPKPLDVSLWNETAEDVLWVAALAFDNAARDVSSNPTGYTTVATADDGSSTGVGWRVASKESTATSDSPDAFVLNAIDQGIVGLLAVRPFFSGGGGGSTFLNSGIQSGGLL